MEPIRKPPNLYILEWNKEIIMLKMLRESLNTLFGLIFTTGHCGSTSLRSAPLNLEAALLETMTPKEMVLEKSLNFNCTM